MTGHIHLQYDDVGIPILEDNLGSGVPIPSTSTGGFAEAYALAVAKKRVLIVDGYSDYVPWTGGDLSSGSGNQVI
jgi:hypothetical protein